MSAHPISSFSPNTPPYLPPQPLAPPTAVCSSTDIPESSDFEKFVTCFHAKFPDYDLVKIRKTAHHVFNAQETCLSASVPIISCPQGTPDFSHAFLITPNTFELVGNQIGRGGYGTVYKTLSFATKNFDDGYSSEPATPTRPRLRAVKIGGDKKRTSTEAYSALRECFPKRQRGITSITFAGNDQEGFPICFQPLRDTDYDKLDLSKLKNPVEATLKVLLEPVGAMTIAHSKGLTYKDFKSDNFLVILNKYGEVEGGELTDLDFFGPVPSQAHQPLGAREYLAPDVFNSLVDQRNRTGIQTTQSDVFTLGVIICLHMLCKIAVAVVSHENGLSKRGAVNAILYNINPTRIYGPFTDEALKNNDQEALCSGYKIYRPKFLPSIPVEQILVYPSNVILRCLFLDLAGLLKDFFSSPIEHQAFIQLAHLSCSMRDKDPMNRPTMARVHATLQRTLNLYVTSQKVMVNQ